HHNRPPAPTTASIPFHPNLTQKELKPLSISITLKSPIVHLPYPPPKRAIISDPTQISFTHLQKLTPPYLPPITQILPPTKHAI
ncbi:Glu/Leu/Phe/Val dehydrogenase dimerization domain-containing protein, partial [Bacillus altitudinis]|uniref:Glu/Leu/Phe/Val dehydrogenase dimerization domain-containing protein n=1 Tax=Bacillus altitudinis TaxID=293387 RepID=UPI0023560BCB